MQTMIKSASTVSSFGPVISGGKVLQGCGWSVGARIAELRQQKGLTQHDLAIALGKKSRTTITQYEAGGITPPLGVIWQIAEILDADASYLAFGNPPSSSITSSGPLGDAAGRTIDGAHLNADLWRKLELPPKSGAIIELEGDAPAFSLSRSDLLILDTSQSSIRADGRLYAVYSSSGTVNLVRTAISLESTDGPLQVTFEQGQTSEVNPENVKVIGLIKATVKRL